MKKQRPAGLEQNVPPAAGDGQVQISEALARELVHLSPEHQDLLRMVGRLFREGAPEATVVRDAVITVPEIRDALRRVAGLPPEPRPGPLPPRGPSMPPLRRSIGLCRAPGRRPTPVRGSRRSTATSPPSGSDDGPAPPPPPGASGPRSEWLTTDTKAESDSAPRAAADLHTATPSWTRWRSN